MPALSLVGAETLGLVHAIPLPYIFGNGGGAGPFQQDVFPTEQFTGGNWIKNITTVSFNCLFRVNRVQNPHLQVVQRSPSAQPAAIQLPCHHLPLI